MTLPASAQALRPLRVAVLAKQVPVLESLVLDDDGRLQRTGVPLEMSAYCRRAVAKGVRLATESAGRCTVFTMGPPSAADVLREAIAFGADAGVHLCDQAFAGSDTLATARALARAVRVHGPFDLVLAGRNSIDADTGQVGPQVAQLLDLPFATGVKQLAFGGASDQVEVGCEHDDEWVLKRLHLPALLTVAERLIDPCKVRDQTLWPATTDERIHVMTAADLGAGPWGADGSPTMVTTVRSVQQERAAVRLAGSCGEAADQIISLFQQGGEVARRHAELAPAGVGLDATTGCVAIVAEPGRSRATRELLGGASRLASTVGASVAVLIPAVPGGADASRRHELAAWGADRIVWIEEDPSPAGSPGLAEEDVAAALTRWIADARPRAVLLPSTAWGREVAGRSAAAAGIGLTGDAIDLELDGDVVAWKPAFGGLLVAAVRARTRPHLVTVRPGALPLPASREAQRTVSETIPVVPRGRVIVDGRRSYRDADALCSAARVIVVGQGVAPEDYPLVRELAALLGAEIGATRKVTDRGWLPHARQVGITGLSLRPDVALLLGVSGSYNHLAGLRQAGLLLAVNRDPDALVFSAVDHGIVADWHDLVRCLIARAGAAVPVTEEAAGC
jgi:electron transfer flavoprotein alpha subunit